MNAMTQPVGRQPPRTEGEHAIREWLDGLANGSYGKDVFLRAIQQRLEADPDGSWEVLSLLDQYYRRGKLNPEVFRAIKSRLEGAALGANEDIALREPPSRPAAITTPVAAVHETASGNTPTHSHTARLEPPEIDVLRGRYRIQRVLGQGGMGTVYEAIDEYRLDLPTADQRLAIKVLSTAVTMRPEALTELRREFHHLQLLSHPNIVRVHEFDRDGDIAFFTMELLSGMLLSRVLSATNVIPLQRPHALAVIRDIGAALVHAHSRGVVHGDINPQNIFITSDGEVRVLDFGASHKLLSGTWGPDKELTQSPPVATLGYASCQLLEGHYPDARDDLFAFACVAYMLLAGEHPFSSRSAIEARGLGLNPRRPAGLTGRQWRTLRTGLHWERERRPSDIQEWLDGLDLRAAVPRLPALTILLRTSPSRKSRFLLATAATILVLLASAGGYWAASDYDSLTRGATLWSIEARSALASAGAFIEHMADDAGRGAEVSNDAGNVPVAHPAPAAYPAPVVQPPRAGRPNPSAVVRPAPGTADLSATPVATDQTSLLKAERAAPASLVKLSTPPMPSPRTAPAASQPITASSTRTSNTVPAHIQMATGAINVPADEPAARITVRRTGNYRGEVSFTWWTESGTAKPGADFAPGLPSIEHIEDGKNSVSLIIPVVSDTSRSQPKSFYVVIDQPGAGAVLGTQTLTMVTILPP